MLTKSPAVWRVLAIGLAFLSGCLFTLLYSSSAVQTMKQNAIIAGHPRFGGHQNLTGSGNWDKDRAGHGEPAQGRKPMELAPKVEELGVKLPEVKSVLPKSDFGSHWTKPDTLSALRSYGAVSNIPDLDVLNTYNVGKLSAIYHSYLDNSDILCHRKLRMGQVGNCGWEVCDDYEWRPIRPCVIYSFGINYEFSFDDDAGKIYGCDVFSFDPSMTKQPTYQRSDRVMYYRVGIGGQSGEPQKTKNGWILHSLSNLRAMLNHTDTVIDVLKMDVEASEWPSLATMLKEKQLRNVRQLLVEYHQTNDNAATLRSRLKIIGDLEREGFRKFYITKNPSCARNAVGIPIKRSSCYEVHYVNAKFRRA